MTSDKQMTNTTNNAQMPGNKTTHKGQGITQDGKQPDKGYKGQKSKNTTGHDTTTKETNHYQQQQQQQPQQQNQEQPQPQHQQHPQHQQQQQQQYQYNENKDQTPWSWKSW